MRRYFFILWIWLCLVGQIWGLPPYGDPNQPYDRLPGTLKTYHVPWAKPLKGGPLKALFIVPYNDSREVVEAAQRIQLDYTVIMNAGPGGWADGYFEGENATPLHGIAAEAALERIARERLSSEKQYDVIVIGKISWEVIPDWVKKSILTRVENGAGLVYVSPNRLQRGLRPTAEVEGEDAEFSRLFESDAPTGLNERIFGALPMKALPLDVETDPAAARGDSMDGPRHLVERARVRLSTTKHGEGRILGLDYHDEMIGRRNSASLTPFIYDPKGDHDVVLYDFCHLLLARCLLWSIDRLPLETPIDTPAKMDRAETTDLGHTIRDHTGVVVKGRPLAAGDYFIDRGLASRSLRVESDLRVEKIETETEWVDPGGAVSGSVKLTHPLKEGESIRVEAIDTWGRVVAKASVVENRFTIDFENPLSELWDLHAVIEDTRGVVHSQSTPVVIHNTVFDDFLFMLIFAPTPGQNGWKGQLHAKRMREFGINSTYTYLIHSRLEQFYQNPRANLRSVAYAEHLGELMSPADHKQDFTVEREDLDLAEISRMCRHIADTGKKLDPAEFPYKMGHIGAKWINGRLDAYRRASAFGSPFYTLTGENYLSGEFNGLENSGFGPTTTKRFQEWCQEEFDKDLGALNAEWNSDFGAWDEVRGILIQDAVEQDQLARWIDFRYFMRSRVWSQFFIDWTDMMRVAIPDAKTGRVGHDHHDFSRYREHMTSSKLYIGQSPLPEWHEAIVAELPQSFSGDQGFLLAPQSTIRWSYDLESEINRERWPWLTLMLGLNGFDWENGLASPTLGGMSAFTPCYSEALPFFKDMAREVQMIQRGIGKLTIASEPHRSDVAILWAPRNHYLSRCLPFEENGFSGTFLSNITTQGGAPSDCLAVLNALRLRPTFIASEDLKDLGKRKFQALLLPYNKAMAPAEATAIQHFVRNGGLVIADNEPGTFTQHGRALGNKRRLADLFPNFKEATVVQHGKGHAAYLPNGFNHFIRNLEAGEFAQAEPVGRLLAKFAGQNPPVELMDGSGQSRRDVFARLFQMGETQLYGMLRAAIDDGSKNKATTLVLPKKAHVWDVRMHKYLGYGDRFVLELDLRPRFFAILKSNPEAIDLRLASKATPGALLKIHGKVQDATGKQAVHLRVFDSKGSELEWFRRNELFDDAKFEINLPLSFSLPPDTYEIRARHAITGAKANTKFTIQP